MKRYPHNDFYRVDEEEIIPKLLIAARLSKDDRDKVVAEANNLQSKLNETHYINKILKAYELSGSEGMALMTLCEALLRTPDKKTQDELIREKLTRAQWNHISEGSFYASVAGVVLTKAQTFATYEGIVSKLGWPTVRELVRQMVLTMANIFVMGDTIQNAIIKKSVSNTNFTYSFDMLGESATNWEDANKYYEKYLEAANSFNDSISIKLSAIHPRYELRNYQDVSRHLLPKIAAIAHICEEKNSTLFIDAEECDKLDLSIMCLEKLLQTYKFKPKTIGFAIQAYQKRALWVVRTIENIAREAETKIVVRLVKGAYWDTEIKIAQEQGLKYPVFTRKELTDLSYLACARALFQSDTLCPAYATHNPFTVAAIYHYNSEFGGEFEFQKLYGMGDGLFESISNAGTNVRVYAPVGEHKDLLAYLVRRLLENGANTSFVFNQQVVDPFETLKNDGPGIPDFTHLYEGRKNSKGFDLTDIGEIEVLTSGVPYHFISEDLLSVEETIDKLKDYSKTWSNTPFAERKEKVLAYADALEEHMIPAANNLVKYAFKTYPNAISEVREAVDFIRYYAEQAEQLYNRGELPGYTGEYNITNYEARGVWLVIAPWNFPLAIFVGPIIAALLTGNTVLAKPAPQTIDIADPTIACMHTSGIPVDAVRLCKPEIEHAELALRDERISGVTFTGSHPSAKKIQRILAERDGPIIPFIAETGGINCMISDSSCLPEQLVKDVVKSAFDSAGQRCSATRFLFLQKDNSAEIIKMLKGAIKAIILGFPEDLNTDVSRVIDGEAYRKVQERIAVLEENEILIATKSRNGAELPKLTVAPSAYLIKDYKKYFDKEVFGPILHVYEYDKEELDDILQFINDSKFGLTLGVHSRISSFHEKISNNVNVGNIYVNRDQIGAVVGTHPFGGVGLSGTGPKAGGPDYLISYVWEKHICINTTAIGGNTVLLSK